MQLDKQLKIAATEAALIKAKVLYTKLNDGIQFMIAVGDKVWDYWPTTGTARSRDGASLDGLSGLLAAARLYEYQLIGEAADTQPAATQEASAPANQVNWEQLVRAWRDAMAKGNYFAGTAEFAPRIDIVFATEAQVSEADAALKALFAALPNQADEDTPPWPTS